MPRGKWRPGPRVPAREKLESRFAWADNFEGEFIIFVQDPKELFEDDGTPKTSYQFFGAGDNVHLVVNPKRSRSSVTLMLTNLTEQELDETKRLFDLAFEWARPVVQLRDREAREALEVHGDDLNPRNYRQVSQLVVRRRPGGEHGEGVRIGSEDVPGVGSDGTEDPVPGSDAADRGTGSEESGVAGYPEEDRFAEDYEKAYYESEEPSDLGGDPAGPREVQGPHPPSIPRPPDPRTLGRPDGTPGGGEDLP